MILYIKHNKKRGLMTRLVEYPFMIKALSKSGIQRKILNLINSIFKKHKANIIFNDQGLNPFPQRWETRQVLLLNITQEVLTIAER